jgi:Reverse transcriptase (RNA-dependent DNA polymerase)/Chromo (CHRromatin Organisation MOdifier) domain
MKVREDDKYASKIAMDAKTSPVVSVRGYKYAFLIICLRTRVKHLILTSLRSEILSEYKSWARNLFNKHGYYPALIRLDKAGEHRNNELLTFFKECGTKYALSEKDQSNENSYAERAIGVHWRQMLMTLTHSGVPFIFWCYAFAWVIFVSNHVPHRGLGFKRPVDVAKMVAADAFIRVFGSYAVYYLPGEKDSDLVGHPSVVFGISDFSKGFYFFDLETKKVVTSRTGVFWETYRPFLVANKGVLLPLKVIAYPQPVDWKNGGDEKADDDKYQYKTVPSIYPSYSPVGTVTNSKKRPFLDTFPPVPSKSPFMPSAPVGPSNAIPNAPVGPPKGGLPVIPGNSPGVPGHIGVAPVDPSLGLPPPSPSPEKNKSVSPLSPVVGSRGKFSGPIFPVSTLPKSGNGQDGGWEVEEILKRRKSKFGPPKLREGHDFLIKWKGFTEPTWEHQSALFQCDEKLREFYEKEGQPFVQVDPSRTLEREFDSISEPDIITGEGVPKMNQISGELGLVDPKAVKSLINNPIENLFNVGKRSSGSKLKYNLRPTKDRIGLPLISEETNSVQPEQVLLPSGSSEGSTRPSSALSPDRPEGIPIPQAEVANSGASYDGEQMRRKAAYVPPPPTNEEYEYFTEVAPEMDEVLSFALATFQEYLNEDGSNELPPANRSRMLMGKRVDEYIEAEERELWGLHQHGTFKVVCLPKDRRKITCTWVYDIKRNGENQIILFKARLVAHGFKQIEGIDYVKTFSSTAQMRSFRMILMLACAYDLELTQYDISNAFLNGELEEEIYMEFPPGYPGKDPNECLKLNKGLYGLKQASRIWNKRLVGELSKAGLEVCKTEPGILHHPDEKCFVCLHVDDIIVATDKMKLKMKIVDVLQSNFLVKILGELSMFVGVQITRDRVKGTIDLDQSAYAERVLRRFDKWNHWKKVKVPAPAARLSKLDVPTTSKDWDDVKDFPYPSVVGSLMYAAVATRPDLMQSVSQLARFMSKWGTPHIKAADQALNFLRGTCKDGIRFTRPDNFDGVLDIYAFSDSDWAGCPDTRRSTTGYLIIICGGPITWKSQQKKTLAMSSCEGEYMSLSEVGKEIVWISNFLTEVRIPFRRPSIFCDSSSAIDWSEDPVQHQRTKHVELQYYYIRDLVASQVVDMYKIGSAENVSDPFTKPTPTLIFNGHRPYIMGWQQVKFDLRKGK